MTKAVKKTGNRQDKDDKKNLWETLIAMRTYPGLFAMQVTREVNLDDGYNVGTDVSGTFGYPV